MKQIIFVHKHLDEAGLDPYEFRLFCHISTAKKGYTESQSVMGEICRMSLRQVQLTLDSLKEKELVTVESRTGKRTNTYKLAPNVLEKLEALSKERKKLKNRINLKLA